MKKTLMLIISVMLLLNACSKANDPYTPQDESILQKVQTYNITGQPVDIDISNECVIVAEDLVGLSIFNRNTGEKYISIDELPETGQLRKTIIVRYNSEDNCILFFDRTISDKHKLHYLSLSNLSNNIEDYQIVEKLKLNNMSHIRDFIFNINTSSNKIDVFFAGFQSNKNQIGTTTFDINTNDIIGQMSLAEVPNAINKIVLTDTHIITAMGQRGVYIIDKSDINNLISQVDTPGDAQSIVVKDNIVYVADLHQGLQLVDITDITNPVLLENSYNMSGEAVSIDIHNNHLAVASNTGGLYIYDISDILSPKLLERKLMSEIGYLYKVQFYQDDLYVASRDKGVIRYSFK
ncbi:MAG: hypothetical protein M0Q94_10395 [Candidatus Cloacimonetes bacterium]|nr:hypothetical protein [Candidatus Cloacimonadota bacterium]